MEVRRERIHMIDGIRGFSLLGILLANLLIFQYGLWGKDDLGFYQLSNVDLFFYYFTKIFIEGSFMPIFTFLFGYSMILMKDSLERKSLKVKRHFLRRALFLILIGWIHSYYLWEGDILFFYGLMTFVLLIFLNRKRKTVLVWGIIVFVLSSIASFGSYSSSLDGDFIPPERLAEYNEQTLEIYGSGNYFEIMDHRNNVFPLDDSVPILLLAFLFAPIISIPMFLFGMYAAKRKIFFNAEKEQKLYKYGMLLIPLSLIMKGSYYYFADHHLMGIFFFLGSNLLALGYIFLFAYLYQRFASKKVFQSFVSVGKLSMTNYLLQSVICTTIFYGYGFGLFAKLGVGFGILLGLAIYAIQSSLSYLYLKQFKFGPMEYMSRMFTYFTLSGRPKVKQVIEKSA